MRPEDLVITAHTGGYIFKSGPLKYDHLSTATIGSLSVHLERIAIDVGFD